MELTHLVKAHPWIIFQLPTLRLPSVQFDPQLQQQCSIITQRVTAISIIIIIRRSLRPVVALPPLRSTRITTYRSSSSVLPLDLLVINLLRIELDLPWRRLPAPLALLIRSSYLASAAGPDAKHLLMISSHSQSKLRGSDLIIFSGKRVKWRDNLKWCNVIINPNSILIFFKIAGFRYFSRELG